MGQLNYSIKNKQVAGIYIHIPFCKSACHYCNFHFSTSLHYKNELLAALLKEVRLQQSFPGMEQVSSLYFGGGTPSLLENEEVNQLIVEIRTHYNLVPDAEITLEANPDDLTEEKLQGWKSAGINRLSIGVQSFFEEDLRWMNRAHTSSQATEGLELALRYFDNITIDLIYGTPGLTDEKWQQNVTKAIALGIPHLSCYALTVEPTGWKKPVMNIMRFLILLFPASAAGITLRTGSSSPTSVSDHLPILFMAMNGNGISPITTLISPPCRKTVSLSKKKY